jgi:hypothetical protein
MPKVDQEEVDKVIEKASMKEVENMGYNLEKTLDNLKKE